MGGGEELGEVDRGISAPLRSFLYRTVAAVMRRIEKFAPNVVSSRRLRKFLPNQDVGDNPSPRASTERVCMKQNQDSRTAELEL